MIELDPQEEARLTERERELLELGRRSELIDEIRAVVRHEITDTLHKHFGGRSPEEVMDVMRTAEKFHKRIEKLAESAWGALLATALKWSLMIFLFAQIVANDGAISKFLPGGGAP